jgi:hypothetical protein
MMQPDTAEERRYRCALPVTLRRRGTDQPLLTSEVSFREAFVRTNDPPPGNSLVRLVITLPPDDAKIAVSAHVTKVIGGVEVQDHYPGFVARFVGLDGPVKARWEALVQALRREYAESQDTTVVFAAIDYVEGFQRKAPAAGDLWLRPATVDELDRIIREDVPKATLFVPSASQVTPGANVTIQLVHPVTEAVFPLEGVVKRPGTVPHAGAEAGIAIGLSPLAERAMVELQEMADSVVVVEDYDVELFDEPTVSKHL